MASVFWQTIYKNKLSVAKDALNHLKNGQTVFVGSGAGEPLWLTQTLAEMAKKFWDLEIIHLTSAIKNSELLSSKNNNSFRYNTFYSGRCALDTAYQAADFTPMNMSDLSSAMKKGIIDIDVALIHVSPPDTFGFCSLGVSVDVTRTAAKCADLVIAQVNNEMPVTMGDSLIHVDNINYLVEHNAPLPEVEPDKIDPVSLTIGRHIASLINNGSVIHFDRGPLSAATMRYLDTKTNLGIHTDVLTDDILRLILSGSVTNRTKTHHKGKTVATMVMGSKKLYKTVNVNPYIEILPIDEVNDPFIIMQNNKMISVLAIEEIELTGLARADSENLSQIRSLPTGTDFIYGANRSKDGYTIMAMPAATPDGNTSRIVAMSSGGGAAYIRSMVDYVVTEYGVVNLRGLSIRERAIALISIAHPKFRKSLLNDAKKYNYVGKNQIIAPIRGGHYPHHYEFTHVFKNKTKIFFRPVKPSDAKKLQSLFYALSPQAARMRYHGTIKALSDATAQRIAAVDYSMDVAIIGLAGPRDNSKIVAEGRYLLNPQNNMGEFDIVVHEDYQGLGIAKFLANYLNKTAYSRGLRGVYAEVITQNSATMGLLNNAWPTATKTFHGGACTFTVKFPKEDIARPKDSIIIYSGRYNDYSYGDKHPFSPGRTRQALQLIRSQGYLDEPWMRVEEPVMITRERLIESHEPDFVDALEKMDSGKWKDEFLKYNVGTDECPIFPGLFDYILLYSSATITGADLIIEENANVVFNPLGGFHHATRNKASGFCYINDAIAAIDMFLSRGMRVVYLDIDAHHGNGVQDAYYRDDRVLTISIHETGKTLYPWGGFEDETGEDIGKGFNINIPLPKNSDDEIFETAFDQVVTKAVKTFEPVVIVAVIGTDMHRSDHMSHLKLTNNAMVHAIKSIRECSNHLLLLGGGGYEISSVTKAWCRMWAAANRIDSLPDYLLVMGGTFLGSEGLPNAELIDMNFRISGDEKKKTFGEIDRIIEFHKKNTLPVIKERANIRRVSYAPSSNP